MSESRLRELRGAIETFNREAVRAARDELPVMVRVAPVATHAARVELCRTRPPVALQGAADDCRGQIRLMTAAEEVNRAIRIARSAGIDAAVTVASGEATVSETSAVTLALAEPVE